MLKAGFAMAADDDPEVVTLPNEAGYVMVAVDRVIEAAPAPLAEIKDRVREDWIHRKATDRARAVAVADRRQGRPRRADGEGGGRGRRRAAAGAADQGAPDPDLPGRSQMRSRRCGCCSR